MVEVQSPNNLKEFPDLVAWINGQLEEDVVWEDNEDMDEAIQFANTIGSLDRSVPDYADFDEVDPE